MTTDRTRPAVPLSRRRWIAAIAALAAAAPASAARIADQDFADRIRLADTDLLLNGVGVRAVAWFTGYAAGLYLRERARTAAQALAQPGPKRLQMKMLVEVEAREWVKAINKGTRRNVPPAELEELQPRIAAFNRTVLAMGTVRRGDVIDLDLMPGKGLVVSRNGTVHGAPIPGDDLYGAVLLIFIGGDPVDTALKAGLLGQR